MHIITQARIWEAKAIWPNAASGLDTWSRLMKAVEPADFAADRLVQAMDQVLALIGDDEDHPLAILASRMGDLIEAYDDAHRSMPQVTGAAALRYLMDERGLGQGDLPEVGTQSVISEILSQRRQINIRQARALSERFALPAALFLAL